MRIFYFLLIGLLTPILVDAEDARTWQGTWNNKKYGTSGLLKCAARVDDKGIWKATFTGLFKGEPFKYNAQFESREGDERIDLHGKAVIRGHNYEWIGAMKGNQLRGRYKSSVGYYGEFSLKEVNAE